MKKFSRILCAVLVLAMLCSSLMFVISAEEKEPAADGPYTVKATTDVNTIFAQIKYDAEDNRLSGASFTTNSVDGWNNPGARQAHLVTNNKTGDVYYREFMEGQFNLKDGSSDGNEFVNYTFNSVSLKYEKGKNEYIIVEYDLAYKAVTGTFMANGKEMTSSTMKQQVIVRGGSETSFGGNDQTFASFGLGGGFSHVTTIYDYTTGKAHLFMNGKYVKSWNSAALTSTILQEYLSGKTVTTSEWRIGSNSYDDYYLDNVYIRHTKVAEKDDTVAKAISSGKLTDWSENIYDENYVMPTPHWFVQAASHTSMALSGASGLAASVVASGVAGNQFNSTGSFGNGHASLMVASSVTETESYVTFFAPSDVAGVKPGNMYYQLNATSSQNLPVSSGSNGYYVIDFDIASHGDLLPYLDISVMLRRVSDGGGFPFSANIEVMKYIDDPNTWSHVTLVGSVETNQVYVYINGVYAGDAGYAFNASQLEGNTAISPKGIRVDLSLTGVGYDFKAGQNIALDNFAQRIYTTADSANGLADAVAAGNLTGWSGYMEGNAGRGVPPIVNVNGVKYNTTKGLDKILSTNDDLEIEFLSPSFMPFTLNANAVINTHGMDFAALVKLHPDCWIDSVDGEIVITKAKYMQNLQIADVSIPGGSRDASIYSAIKYDVAGNLFTDVFHNSATSNSYLWGTAGHRKASLLTNVDTGDVIYRESAVLNADGKMIDEANEYVNLNFEKTNLQYTAGQNEYIVADFDFGTDDVINDAIGLQLIPRSTSGGAWANQITLKDLPIAPGTMAHVTVVYDFTENYAHVFVNGRFVYSVDDGAMDDVLGGAKDDVWTKLYLTGTAFTVSELKITSDQKTSTICLDNLAIRSYKYSDSSDALAAAVASGDITDWADSIYSYNYKTSRLPAVAKADGVEYGSIDALNEALAEETVHVKDVEILHTPKADSVIKICNDTVLDSNTLAIRFDYKTGSYTFKHSDPLYVSTETGLAYASNRLVLIHNDGDSVYSFITIDEDNCTKYATPVQWCYDTGFEKVDVMFFVYGDQITAPECPPYVNDGKLYISTWHVTSTEAEIGDIADSYPVASAECGELWYVLNVEEFNIDCTATNLKYSATIGSQIALNLYVKRSETVSEGNITVIDGVEYVCIVTHIAPAEIGKPVTVEFNVQDALGNVYAQKQELSFVDYATKLLADEEQSDSLKTLLVQFLAYANEAHKLSANGETIEAVDALLAEYSSYVIAAEIGESLDVTSLKSVVRSASMILGSRPEFVFKVARGFKGLVTFTYTGVNGEVEVIKGVDATFSEKLAVLDGVDVRDVASEITVTFTDYVTGEIVATGSYSLATYVNGLEAIENGNTDFAYALAAYSKAALAYTESETVFDI